MKKNIILFVDDEDNILNAIKRAVAQEDFTALFASSGAEALTLMKDKEISVLVTDMMMPEMDGLSLLKETKLLYPMTIRMILSGYTQLSQILDAVNQGDIFRFITKPWNMEDELLAGVRQGIEYYNLRRDKQELEKSLQQKNTAYKNMLRTLEEKFSNKQEDLGYLKKFTLAIVSGLEKEFTNNVDFKGLLKLQLVREMATDYFKTIPVVLEDFDLQDITDSVSKYLTENNDNGRYQVKAENTGTKCFGNFKFLIMILLTVAKILCRLGGDRTFKHVITSQSYPNKGIIRINNVIEFGYVDGAKIVIDAEELLSHANLEFYTGLLAQIGQPYQFDIAYTYVNQNTSLIAISAEVSFG